MLNELKGDSYKIKSQKCSMNMVTTEYLTVCVCACMRACVCVCVCVCV